MMLENKPDLKRILHHVMMNELTAQPRWFTRMLINPFFIKRGKGSIIKAGARLDLIPSKRFIVGNHCVVETRTTINNQVGDVVIEDDTMITTGVTIVGPVHIGKNVIVGNGTLIFGMRHNYENPDLPVSAQGISTSLTTICDDSWIGGNVVINQGVTIGKHSLVGTGSVVTRDVPPYCIVAGVPAKIIKKYDFQKNEWVLV